MSIKTVKEESLIALGDAIRSKTGGEEALEFPNGMIEAISCYAGKLPSVIDGSVTNLTEEDFGNATTIRPEGFWQCSNLTDVALPDTIRTIKNAAFSGCSQLTNVKMSRNISEIQGSVFNNCSRLKVLRFETSSIPTIASDSFPKAVTLEVPGEKYDEYLNRIPWGTIYKAQLSPYSEYVPTLVPKTIMEYNSSKMFEISLQNYTTPPEVNITVADPTIAEVMINSIDSETILFSVFSKEVEGSTTIEFQIPGKNDFIFSRSIAVEVWAELIPSSYTVENIEDVTYGFELNEDGYYESTNKNISDSFAYCKININNMMGLPVYIDCISYGENNYDYGLFSAVNSDLSKNTSDGLYLHSFKGLSSPAVQTLEYLDAIGDCYITVKYRKDGSGNNNKDTLQFKVRFGE